MTDTQKDQQPVVIKKYANRRLYDTETSSYVTLEDIRLMVKNDKCFVVKDAKSGEDLTRQILTQIILEQELKGSSTMPADFLRGVIKMHDDQVGAMMQHYLDSAMKAFASNQDAMREYLDESMATFNAAGPIAQFEEISKRNIEMFQKTMDMFTPAGMFGVKRDDKK